MVEELKVEDIFSAEALEALELLPLKCRVSQEHCIILLEIEKKMTNTEGEKNV